MVINVGEHKEMCQFRPTKCRFSDRGCPQVDLSFKNAAAHEEQCRHKQYPVGTEETKVEGEGDEVHDGPQERWFKVDGFW